MSQSLFENTQDYLFFDRGLTTYKLSKMDPRIAQWIKRKASAKRKQLAMRRYRASTDQRQLGTIIRSYRKANPYQIQPSIKRAVTFWRKTELSLSLDQLNGFGVGGNSLNWGFSLGFIYGFLNGVFTYAPVVPNASEFQALFDYYKINSVKMQIFYSKNTADAAVTPSTGLPLLLICNDFDDVGESMTLTAMNQRVGCRHVQFDANNTNGVNHYVKPKPTSVMVQTDPVTGAATPANAGIPMGSTWLDTAQSNILHSGVKIFYDNQGLTTSVKLGNVTFVFDVEYVFTGYR